MWQVVSFAGVNITSKTETPSKKQMTRIPLLESSPQQKDVIRQLEVEGYANSVYVRVVIEITNNKNIVGQMFYGNGVATYVYGEKLEGVLHLYGEKGGHFTVIVP